MTNSTKPDAEADYTERESSPAAAESDSRSKAAVAEEQAALTPSARGPALALDPLALDIDAAFDALQLDLVTDKPLAPTAAIPSAPNAQGRPLSMRPLAGSDDWGFISLEKERSPSGPPRAEVPPSLSDAPDPVEADALELTEFDALESVPSEGSDGLGFMDLEPENVVGPGDVTSIGPARSFEFDLAVSVPPGPSDIAGSDDGIIDFTPLEIRGDDAVGVANPPLEVGSEGELLAIEPVVEVPSPATEARADFAVDDNAVAIETTEFSDDEMEIVIDGGEGEEVEIAPPTPRATDRGALLAATVTSRRKEVEGIDRLYASDARAEAKARAELLVEECDGREGPIAGEGMATAAEIIEGVLGDRTRARMLVERARLASPEAPSALRVLRRIALSEGNLALARTLCDEAIEVESDAEERKHICLLAAELAASERAESGAEYWARVGSERSVLGALAGLFGAAARRDNVGMGEALERWASTAQGGLGATLGVARARIVESDKTDAALRAIRAALESDASDAGAWLAMARIALARSQPSVLHEALAGIVQVGEGGALATAAGALRRGLAAVMGEPFEAGVVEDAGVSGWLNAHALQESSGDPSMQVAFGLEHSAGAERSAWARWSKERRAEGGAAGAFLALRAALIEGARTAEVAGEFFGGNDAAGAAAGLSACEGRVAPAEGLLFGDDARRILRAGLGAADGLEAAEAAYDGPVKKGFGTLASAFGSLSKASDVDVQDVTALLESDVPGVSVSASRFLVSVRPLVEAVSALRTEAAGAKDPRRSAGQRLLGAALALSWGVGVEGASDDARSAAESLPGDLAAAELAALFALRGELNPEAGADALAAAAASGDGVAHRMAGVRSALRRASIDPEAAADAVWRVWNRSPGDASLGALVLRSPSPRPDRAVVVLRSLADAAHTGGGGPGSPASKAAVPVGIELAAELEQSGRFADAAQAVARARTTKLHDPTLSALEQRLWLRAGMFAEVAERVFDQLKSAERDDDRAVAYEALGDLDRIHRDDPATAVSSYLALLEVTPGHMPTLRTLERHFLEQGRFAELGAVYERLVHFAVDGDDALAWAHQAARCAELEAEGDPAAAVGYYQLALERGLADRRSLLALDAELRRSSETERWGGLQARLAGIAGAGLERATHLCRAAEAREAFGDAAHARELFEEAVTVEPFHPTALAGVAEHRLAAGDVAGAAAAFERLGREAKVIETSVEWLFRAATLWNESAIDTSRALAVAREALGRDPRHAPSFDLAISLLRAAADTAGELEVLESRGEAEVESGDPGKRLEWHLRAAVLAERLGEQVRARSQWRAVVRLQPESLEALRALVRLSREAADWAGAADAMIRLAKTTTDMPERVEMLYGLGEVFDDHIVDARRAEAAYRRALQFDAGEVRCLRRLADLYSYSANAPHEAEMLQALAARTAPGPDRVAVLLRLAVVLEAGLGDVARAEQALALARRDAPTDLTVLRAVTAFYESKGNTMALELVLDRAAGEVRRALDRDPQQVDPLERLTEILALRHDVDGAQVVASVAAALGVRSESLEGHAAGPRVAAVGIRGLDNAAVALLSPPAITTQIRDVLAQLGSAVDALVPVDLRRWGADRLGGRPHPLRAEVDRMARELGLGSCEIFLCSQLPGLAIPLSRTPATLLISLELSDDAVGRAAVNRALTLMALSLSLPLRLTAKEFALVLSAMLRQFEPMYRGPGVEAAPLDDLARKITRSVPRDRILEVTPTAFEAIEAGAVDADAIHDAALEFGDRVSALVSGDFEGAFQLRVPRGVELSQGLTEIPSLGRLVRVCLSERFLEARRLATAEG